VCILKVSVCVFACLCVYKRICKKKCKGDGNIVEGNIVRECGRQRYMV
jgi:hypothetical protein